MRGAVRLIFGTVLAWMLLLPTGARAQPTSFEGIIARTEASVVTILGYDVGMAAPRSQGTGFFVAPEVVATNHHVVDKAGFLEVRPSMAAPPLRVLRVLVSDPKLDVALLEVEEPGPPLFLSVELPRVGEEILVISSPLGLEKTVSRGVISGLRNIEGRTVCQITAPVSRGSSGGPIVNSDGEVVGMTSFTIGDALAQNLNFGILAGAIRGLMEADDERVNTRLHIGAGKHGEILITD